MSTSANTLRGLRGTERRARGTMAPRPYGRAIAGTCLITIALRRWVRGVSSNSIVVLVQRACVEEGVGYKFHLASWGICDLRLAGSGRSLLVSLANFQGTHMHPAHAFVWSSWPSLAAGEWSVDGAAGDCSEQGDTGRYDHHATSCSGPYKMTHVQ